MAERLREKDIVGGHKRWQLKCKRGQGDARRMKNSRVQRY
jgi:hypothetical protein